MGPSLHPYVGCGTTQALRGVSQLVVVGAVLGLVMVWATLVMDSTVFELVVNKLDLVAAAVPPGLAVTVAALGLVVPVLLVAVGPMLAVTQVEVAPLLARAKEAASPPLATAPGLTVAALLGMAAAR